MAAASLGDRRDIASLHNPRNHRDASTSSGPWRHDPTDIQPPRKTFEQIRAAGQSPYTTMGSSRRTTGLVGNRTANTTMLRTPATKKRKIERGQVSKFFADGKARHTGKPLTGPDTMFIEDNEEDLGTPLTTATTDDMNVIDIDLPISPKATTTRHVQRPKPNAFVGRKAITSLASDGQRSSGPHTRDGPSTQTLERKLSAQHEDTESDPITYFTEDSELFPMTLNARGKRGGNVNAMVAQIEGTVGPRVDLRLKSKMRAKDTSSTQRDTFGTASSFPGSSRSPTQQLPVKEWYLGTEHKCPDVGYYLCWDKNMMTFMQEPVTTVVRFNVESEIKSIKHFECGPGSRIQNPIIAMQTFPGVNNLPKRNNEFFKMGDNYAKGTITVKFDMDHNNWRKGYLNFIKWIRTHVDTKTILNDTSASSVWEIAERSGEFGMIHANRNQRMRQNSIEEIRPDKQQRSLKRPASVETLDLVILPFDKEATKHSSDRHSVSTSNSRAATKPPSMTSRNSNAEPPILPRSTRQSTRQRESSPEVDPDEVILCYPQGVPGAVNITNADFRRLQPGEFLNDTLIEFGLKLWLQKLEEASPEVANQVHVFSSFFYKKLNKKDINEGYQSVRKWTSKIDIFSKKFLIVPINENLHWYLAIIYQPEFILRPPPPPPPPLPPKETRQRTHHGDTAEQSTIVSESSTADTGLFSSPSPEELPVVQETSSEAAVERDLQQFETSCSLTATSENSSTASAPSVASDDAVPECSPSLFVMEIDDNTIQHPVATRGPSPTVSDYAHQAGSDNHPTHDINMIDISSSSSQDERNNASHLFSNDMNAEYASNSGAIAPVNFYGKSKKAKGKEKAIPEPQPSIEMDNEDEEEVAVSSSPEAPLTYIFTMDSLGGRHPAAVKRLQRYLHLEAEDKRMVMETSSAQGKQAIVPVQPNFCDCGLYLLHFAETFVNDPEKYCRIISSTNNRTTNEVRREYWDDAKTAGMRDRMVDEITALSMAWKRARAERDEAKKNEAGPTEVPDSSDDEVDIVDVTPAFPETGKGKGKGKGKAARIRAG